MNQNFQIKSKIQPFQKSLLKQRATSVCQDQDCQSIIHEVQVRSLHRIKVFRVFCRVWEVVYSEVQSENVCVQVCELTWGEGSSVPGRAGWRLWYWHSPTHTGTAGGDSLGKLWWVPRLWSAARRKEEVCLQACDWQRTLLLHTGHHPKLTTNEISD